MYIVFFILWKIVVKYGIYIVYVNTSGSHVCRYEDICLAASETVHNAVTHGVLHIAVKPFCEIFFFIYLCNNVIFTYPAGRIRIPNDSKSRAGGVLYSDYSLGRFFAEAARQPWFENTIFLVTADHCASSAGRTEIPLQKYHIPALILAPGLIEPGVVDGIVSQIDLMPTLLSLLNMSYDSHFYGRSIFDPAYVNRAFIATYQDLGYLEGDTFTILSPVRRFEQYRVVPTEENPHHLEAMERKDAVQVDRAIGYYQTSCKWNKR